MPDQLEAQVRRFQQELAGICSELAQLSPDSDPDAPTNRALELYRECTRIDAPGGMTQQAWNIVKNRFAALKQLVDEIFASAAIAVRTTLAGLGDEDSIQEGLLRMYSEFPRMLARYRGPDKFLHLVRVACMFEKWKLLKWTKRDGPEFRQPLSDQEPAKTRDVLSGVLARELLALYVGAYPRTASRDLRVFRLRVLCEMAFQEIAACLGTSEENARIIYFRTLRRFRDMLAGDLK